MTSLRVSVGDGNRSVSRITSIVSLVSLCLVGHSNAFVPHRSLSRVIGRVNVVDSKDDIKNKANSDIVVGQSRTVSLFADTQEELETSNTAPTQVQELGLLTFDLDDTLYPIAPVVEAANGTLFHCLFKQTNKQKRHIAEPFLTLCAPREDDTVFCGKKTCDGTCQVFTPVMLAISNFFFLFWKTNKIN